MPQLPQCPFCDARRQDVAELRAHVLNYCQHAGIAADIAAHIASLVAALRAAKVEHRDCATFFGDQCDCGADAHNAAIEKAIKESGQ